MSIDTAEITNPYLTGGNAPVSDELDVADLTVHGTIPETLQGAYLRNGPNPQFTPLGRYHLFDGDGMIHAVTIADGRASYRNRWIESAGLLAERRAGRALFGGLSEFHRPDPDVVAEVGLMKNTSNTHIVRHAGTLLSLMEAARPVELTGQLATVGEYDFDGRLAGSMTAHPKIDPTTGEMIFFGYSPLPPYLRLHTAAADGELVHSRDIALPAPVMMHDFAVSERRIVLFDLPAVFDLEAMFAGGEGIRWDPSNGARIGVVDRHAEEAEVAWIEVDPFFMFHTLNAYDDGDIVVVEGCRAPRLNVSFGGADLAEVVHPKLHRWRIDTVAGTVTDEPLDDRPGDFPRINDDWAGLGTRYGYVARARSWATETVAFDGVVKHDFASGTSEVFTYSPTALAGEAAFAPDPTRDDEDAGWLMNFVYEPEGDRSDLVIVDAQALEVVARIEMPRRVPTGFHGAWLADH